MTTVTNKNGIEFDIDALATDVNGKMDKDGINATCPVITSRTPNNYGGIVEIWSDGYCVQTGIIEYPSVGNTTINFSKTYINKPVVTANYVYENTNWTGQSNIISISVSSFIYYNYSTANAITYRAEGYIR